MLTEGVGHERQTFWQIWARNESWGRRTLLQATATAISISKFGQLSSCFFSSVSWPRKVRHSLLLHICLLSQAGTCFEGLVWPLSCPNCCLETSPDTFLPLLRHSATVCYFSYTLLHPTQSTTQVLKFNKAGYMAWQNISKDMKSICQWWRITFQLMHWVPGCKFSANIIWLAFKVLPMWTICLTFFSRTSKKDSIWFMYRCFELSRCISCRYLDEKRLDKDFEDHDFVRLCPASQDSRG